MDLRAITDLEGGRLQSGKLFGPVGPAAISHQFQDRVSPLPIRCGSTTLSPIAGDMTLRFSPSSVSINVMLTNHFYYPPPLPHTHRCRQSKRTMGPRRVVRHNPGATTVCTG
jgi:hypothetical protein